MDAPLKKILRALSLELRHTLEGSYTEDGTWNAGDLERRLNQIGIWRDRPVKPISEMPNLSPVDRKARELIDAYLALRSDAGVSQSDAVAEFIRESAYSWANRLFALRCMEARGIIDPVILQEEVYHGRSMVHDRFAQTNPTQCTDEDDGLFAMLSEEFQGRSQELPDLFAPDSPAVALRPSVVALKHCIALLSGSVPANGGRATDEVFIAPDAFGWAYQFWNEEEKKRINTRIKTVKGAKIDGCDIAPYTTLYTEPYMVKFLVQNSLGATWMMMHPESNLSAAWEYYVKGADRTPNEKKPLAEITFLDPACGSGHFLIEAFDLLYAMYEEEGQVKGPVEICQSILNNNLFGIDIDERAVQITKAVLWMKAAETVFAKTKQQLTGDDFSEFHDHIIATNIRLPNGKDHLDAFLKKHPEDAPLRPALLTVFEGLQNVHELGSLVQIEEPVEKELKVLKEQAKQQKFDPLSGEVVEKVNFTRWKQQVMKRLKAHFQDEAEKALPTEAFFSQSAVKGLALFDLLAQRYDVVAANPPYMGSRHMGKYLNSYIDFHYHSGRYELYSSFIIRNFQLCKENGKIAMVTQQHWLFFKNFSDLRHNPKNKNFKGLLTESTIETIAHLGPRSFTEIGGEVVNSILFSISKKIPQKTHHISCFRLINEKSPEEKQNLLKKILLDRLDNYSFRSQQSNFLELPLTPISYWLSNSWLDLFKNNNSLDFFAFVREGLHTTDNARYVRMFWECSHNQRRWIPYIKGGSYGRWAGIEWYCVDWENDGQRIRNMDNPVIPSYDLYFRNAFTYTFIANGSFGVRHYDDGRIFDAGGPIILSRNGNTHGIVAILNCRPITYLLRAITPNVHFPPGYVKSLPIPDNLTHLSQFSQICIEYKKYEISLEISEYSFDFSKLKSFLTDYCNKITAFRLSTEWLLEKYFSSLLKIDEREVIKTYDDVGTPAGIHPLLAKYDAIPPFAEGFSVLPEVVKCLNDHKRIFPSQHDLEGLKKRLKLLYISGFGAIDEEENEDKTTSDDEESFAIGAPIPIPSETFLEELSQKMEIHPISIYWLLKDGIEKEGWRCLPEEKRHTEDLFTVMVLRLLGHRWPNQIEAGESVPEWADADGIIPIPIGFTHPTLLQQVRYRIAVEFPSGKVHEIEKEFEEVVGMSLERWLAGEFFKHHISQFKKRPIAWQLSSSPSGAGAGKGKGRGSRREPAFSCLVYYHKIDADILHKIRTQYVGDLINRYGTELRALEGRKEQLTEDQASRKIQLDNWITELKDFAQVLQDVADAGFDSAALRDIVKKEPLDKWTSSDGKSTPPKSSEEFYAQERRYDPDINDGVRVNIAPLQKAGLLAAEVIAKKDVEKAIADRAEWREDERRWCREGKLPKCGWWE